MGSEQQDARKEIISLKEQLASTSQVSLGKSSSLFFYPRISFLFSKIRFYLQLDLKNLLRAVFSWVSKSKTKVISVTNRSVEMEHLFYVNALRSGKTIYFIDCSIVTFHSPLRRRPTRWKVRINNTCKKRSA